MRAGELPGRFGVFEKRAAPSRMPARGGLLHHVARGAAHPDQHVDAAPAA